MYNVEDELEARADDLPLRRIKALDLDHVTLVVNKQPVYTQTVSVSGMTEDWVPGIPTAVLGSSVAVSTLLAATEALGCIKMITSAVGTLTFTAPEDKPSASLTLRVPGMVERS